MVGGGGLWWSRSNDGELEVPQLVSEQSEEPAKAFLDLPPWMNDEVAVWDGACIIARKLRP